MKKKYFTGEEKKEAKKKSNRKNYQRNKEKILKKQKIHRKEHPGVTKTYNQKHGASNQKKYRENHPEKIRKQKQDYRKNNKEKIAKYHLQYCNNRRRTDINYKLACCLRGRIRKVIKNNWKLGSAIQDLGCTVPELKLYLEVQFKPGMTWDNWSFTGWHVDHIIPLDSFNLQNREEFLKACHYTNLQPLWAEENLKKSNKLDKSPRM